MSGQRVHSATRVDFYTSHRIAICSGAGADSYIERQKQLVQPVTPMPVDWHATANVDGALSNIFAAFPNPIGREGAPR